jgi:flagellar FliJ protein
MKKFAFRLETLLHYRKNLEEKEQAVLFQLFSRLQRESNHLQDLQEKHQETLEELTQMRAEGAVYGETSWFYLYLDRLRFEMRRSSERIRQLEQDIQEQKAVLVEASKKKKILDSLKTKEKKAFISAVDKQEQKAVDEIVVIRFPHKQDQSSES